jgi:quercetin dioxygenase-like cupin family protein
MMKAVVACAAALVLLGGCIFVRVRDTGADTAADVRSGLVTATCDGPVADGAAIVATPVATSPIADAPGKTMTAVRLDVPPGAKANPHKHAGITFVYVLEGTVCSQITGDTAPKAYSAGDTFFEPPGSHHLGFTNPTSKPAKVLVTFVANTGDTLTSPIQ